MFLQLFFSISVRRPTIRRRINGRDCDHLRDWRKNRNERSEWIRRIQRAQDNPGFARLLVRKIRALSRTMACERIRFPSPRIRRSLMSPPPHRHLLSYKENHLTRGHKDEPLHRHSIRRRLPIRHCDRIETKTMPGGNFDFFFHASSIFN